MNHPLRLSGLAAATLLALTLLTLGPVVSPAAASVTATEETAAARHGAEWITVLQEPSGELASFGGDWSMIGLASVGINAADVRVSPTEPSAQDFYLSLWTGSPPALFSATDFERAILTGYSGGLEPSRLDAHTNLVADLAAHFNGHELGEKGASNANVFGVLALSAIGAPSDVTETLAQTVREQQNADGGWNFAAGANKSEADLTGAALAALCTDGVSSTDPAVVQALSYLHTIQDTATGGFGNPTVNTDSTAWVVSGLNACKIDPNAAEWTTTEAKTPIDFLLAQQNGDGSFQRHAHDEEEDFYSTQDAVRALTGTGFIAPPPPRSQSAPTVRPAPTVAAGTPVPMTLVLDSAGHPTGGSSIRMCKVIAPVGATVAQVLADASDASLPSYCLSDFSLQDGRISRVNGVSAEPGESAWEVRREGGASELKATGTVGLGALIQIRLVPSSDTPGAPTQSPPSSGAPMTTTPLTTTAGTPTRTSANGSPRLGVRVRALTRVHHGRLTVELSCAPQAGAAGCSGVVRVRVALRARRGAPVRRRVVGEGKVQIAAGASRTMTIDLSASALRALRARDDRVAWIVAAMRDTSSGTSANTSASTVLR